MSRLTIDISPEQHKSLKALAALEGKTIRQYALERLFPRGNATERSNAQPKEALGETGANRRPITLGDLLDKDQAAMDGAEKAAWTSFLHFLEQRAEEARSEPPSARTIDDIFNDVMREEGHASQ
jgi:hypothetical protein